VRVALDTNIFAYVMRDDPKWGQPAYDMLKRIEALEFGGIASVLCLSEVLVKPFSISTEAGLSAQLFMEGLEGIDFFAVDLEIAIKAGELRGRHGRRLKTADAIHIATAMVQRADVLVTNDHELASIQIDGLRIAGLEAPLP
jgi:predicted nucleic acid-binding protein